VQPRAQLAPDAIVGPVSDVFVGGHLKVLPGDVRRAHAVQRETVVMAGVDELFRRWVGAGQDAEPRERIDVLEEGELFLNGGTADAVETVAPCDDVSLEALLRAVVRELNAGVLSVEVFDAHVVNLEVQRQTGVESRRDEVLHDLLLPVDRDPRAGQVGKVDAV
jgi:hypothetical protein